MSNEGAIDGNKFIQKVNERHSITITSMENEIALLTIQIEQLKEENKLYKEQINRLKSSEEEEQTKDNS